MLLGSAWVFSKRGSYYDGGECQAFEVDALEIT